LRAGATPKSSTTGAGSSTTGAAAAAATAGLPSQADRLARTTQALQAVQAMQAAAQAAALVGPNNLGADPNHTGQTLPNVPNGLAPGGLVVLPGVAFQGASAPVQATAGGQTTVTISQTAEQAFLNWQTFNVGKNTTVDFDQSLGGTSVGQWIAFNKITDPTGVPSQILGSIQAQGQVYLINQNGIIFGGSAQVNTHTLVATALPINGSYNSAGALISNPAVASLLTLGLLNNPDLQFLFSTLTQPAGTNGTAAFTPPSLPTGLSRTGDVTVQPGASLASPASSDHVGGLIALIGSNVTNGGAISTPDGQTILAAGLQVGVVAHNSADPSLRGLDVSIGTVGSTSGSVTNSGLINAPEADVTIAGENITQAGFINSSTSVSLNGRIDLLANYNAVSSGGLSGSATFFPQNAGTVTLGPNSVTQVLPELAAADVVVGNQLALSSQVNLQGFAIYLGANATILAPGAAVAVNAGNWFLSGSGFAATNEFLTTGGQVYLDVGAQIDAAGSTDVAGSVTQDIVAAQLLGSELANSPLQRNGPLRGQTILVDILQSGTFNGTAWVGTPLADVSGYVNLVQRTVGELTVNGGTVTVSAGNSVVMQPGSQIDVSAGWINFAGGLVQTSQVISGGHIFNIAQATPDLVYAGIVGVNAGQFTVNSSRYGVAQTFGNPTLTTNPSAAAGSSFEAGYIQGGQGGTLSITAPAVALDGSLVGQAVAGTEQRVTPPAPSSFTLTFQGQYQFSSNSFPEQSLTPPAIIFQSNTSLPAVPAFGLDRAGNPLPLPTSRLAEVILPPELVGPWP